MLCPPKRGGWGLFKYGDPMDDATAIDEAASTLTSPRSRVESFFQMKDSDGDVALGVGVALVGAVKRDFPRG